MKVLVDTNIWSLALRRKANVDSQDLDKLKNLILSNQVVMIGPVRQELLSGIADENGFNKLKAKLEAFDDFPISTQNYVTAAKFYNHCRRKGVQGSMTDFLICAAAADNNMLIYTNDKDFYDYSEYLPIKLYK